MSASSGEVKAALNAVERPAIFLSIGEPSYVLSVAVALRRDVPLAECQLQENTLDVFAFSSASILRGFYGHWPRQGRTAARAGEKEKEEEEEGGRWSTRGERAVVVVIDHPAFPDNAVHPPLVYRFNEETFAEKPVSGLSGISIVVVARRGTRPDRRLLPCLLLARERDSRASVLPCARARAIKYCICRCRLVKSRLTIAT